ncbi:MAG: hypothetical protein PHH82_02930 [Candidatus ainarchaeum sp.]|nr:hypothetical protein [Candidatus ainarchaeum sp.]
MSRMLSGKILIFLLLVVGLFLSGCVTDSKTSKPSDFKSAIEPQKIGPECVELFLGHNKQDENRINFVIVGIDFFDLEAVKMAGENIFDLNEQHNGLFSKQPFKSNKEKFNVWYVTELGNSTQSIVPEEHPAVSESKRLLKLCDVKNKVTLSIIYETQPYEQQFKSILENPIIAPVNILLPKDKAELKEGYIGTGMHEIGHALSKFLKDQWLDKDWDTTAINDEYYTPGSINKKTISEGKTINFGNCYGQSTYNDCLENSKWGFLIGNGCGQDGVIDCLAGIEQKCESLETMCKSKNCEDAEEVKQICEKYFPEQKNCTIQNLKESKTCKDLVTFTEPAGAQEVNCWAGCGSSDIWRPTYTSIMSYYQEVENLSYGPVNERILCLAIRHVTGSVSDYCNQLCLDGCEKGEKCIKGGCKKT